MLKLATVTATAISLTNYKNDLLGLWQNTTGRTIYVGFRARLTQCAGSGQNYVFHPRLYESDGVTNIGYCVSENNLTVGSGSERTLVYNQGFAMAANEKLKLVIINTEGVDLSVNASVDIYDLNRVDVDTVQGSSFEDAVDNGCASALNTYGPNITVPPTISEITTALEECIKGPGDYAVTLTIRDTGGVAIPGVKVWLNTSNDRTTSVVEPACTNASGQVTFYLNYTTYYVFCNLAGYSFASASFTAAAGSVTFTKDIGTAVENITSGFADSFLTRAINATRDVVDEPDLNAKYTDTKVLDKLEQAFVQVVNEINRNAKNPAVVKLALSISNGKTEYQLPPNIGSVLAIYAQSTGGYKVFYHSRSNQNTYGRNIWIEHNTLHVQNTNILNAGSELIIEYVPDGGIRLHNGNCTVNADGDEVTLGSTPNSGSLDTRYNAYAGHILRILGAGTGDYVQERTITDYDRTTRVATLDVALDPIPTGTIYYEIVPPIHRGLDSAVPLYAGYLIAATEGNYKRARAIQYMYRDQLRNLRLTSYYSDVTNGGRVQTDSHMNSRYMRF